jgi:hypothetical protein
VWNWSEGESSKTLVKGGRGCCRNRLLELLISVRILPEAVGERSSPSVSRRRRVVPELFSLCSFVSVRGVPAVHFEI